MRKMLASSMLAAFLAACGGGGGITDIPPNQKCSVSLSTSTAQVSSVISASVGVSTANCLAVEAIGVVQIPSVGSTLTIPAGTPSGMVTVRGTSSDGSVSTATVTVVVLPSPIYSIDRSKTAATVELNSQMQVYDTRQNIASCRDTVIWNKSGKEDANTIPPAFSGEVFHPGSSMPAGARTATLKVECTGIDGSRAADQVQVTLTIPRIQVDSISPSQMKPGASKDIFFFSSHNTFVSNNGVDFDGTVEGLCPIMFTNAGNFLTSGKYAIGLTVGSGVPVGDHASLCINNSGRPASETQVLTVTVVP